MSTSNEKINGDTTIHCPACERPTPPAELSAFRGVCQFCQRSFLTAHSTWVKGKFTTPETAGSEIIHRHNQTLGSDSAAAAAFLDGGETTGFQDFPYDQIQLNGETKEFFDQASENVRSTAGTALAMILEWCWSGGFETAQRRFAVASAGLRPELVSDQSWQEIAERLNCTRAALSKAAINFQKHFGIKFSRSRSESARRHMAAAMQGNKNRRNSAARTPTHINQYSCPQSPSNSYRTG
jgi:endogenous inhibitor of DNA gyrase (YacG/DUF329 family)